MRVIRKNFKNYTLPSKNKGKKTFPTLHSTTVPITNEGCSRDRTHLTEFEHKQADFVGQLAVYQAQEQELSAKLVEISREKEALQKMLEEGRCFTKAEVLRLKGTVFFHVQAERGDRPDCFVRYDCFGTIGEFDAIQYLHGWELVKFAGNQVQLRHLEEFTVLLTLDARGSVTAAQFELHMLDKSVKAEVTRFLFDKVVANIQWALEHPSIEGKARHARVSFTRLFSSVQGTFIDSTRRIVSCLPAVNPQSNLIPLDRRPTSTQRSLSHLPRFPHLLDILSSTRLRFSRRFDSLYRSTCSECSGDV